ncbi:MAG TPA: hypothetical protein VGD80_29570, partial [Kofleriaceae bacterium]
ARLRTVQTGNQGNAAATTTLPTGQQQTDVGRAAVEEPQAEQDARAQHGVVTEVDDRPPPSPEIEQACARIRQVIRDKRPPDEDKLVDAKPREMAQEAGNQMSAGVQERTDSVRKGYSDMQQPPPGSPSSTPVPPTLPPERAQTQAVDAGAGAPDPLKPDDVSLDADVADQKKKIEDAGMNTEPGKLVKDGPIGDARGGVDDLQGAARTDPHKVLADQAAAIAKAKGDMHALQQAADKALADARAGAVDQMATHTTGVKGSEEQQRAQAGEKMKAVFDRTQKSVDALLQPLSGDAVARWDAGVAQLSTEFEASLADVKRRIDERHSGVGGLFTSAWDWATGLPDWVTEGYDRAEAKFGDGATNLIRDISRDVNKVIEDCKQIIQQARKDIDAIVKSLPASLQTWAQGEAAKLNTQLDALDKRVDQTQKGVDKDLIGRADGAVQQVREQVADLREKAKGFIAKVAAAIVEFAKYPAKAIVNGLLHILGIPPDSFWSMIDRLGDVVGAIAKEPVQFGKTLISGAAQGFAHFFEHFPKHLGEILMSWLFGTMGAAGVPMPTDFSGPGIMATVLGIVGIDSGMVSSMLGADITDPAEMAEVHQELHGVLSGDPRALVELLREHFDPSSLIPLIKEAAINFLVQAIIVRVAVRIAAMLVPGGAILQAVEAIFRVLVWVVTNAARIFTLIESLVATAGQAVAGNVSGVAAGVETALTQIIVLVIDFLAGYLGVGGLPGKLKGVIMKLSGKLKGALKKVIDAIKKRAKGRAKAKHPGNAHAPGQAPHHDPHKAPDGQDPKKRTDHDDDRDPKKRTDHDDDRDPRRRKPDDDRDPKRRRHDDDHDPRKRKPDDDDPKKRKHDDDKKRKQDREDRALVERIARQAAAEAWRLAKAATTPRVLPRTEVEAAANRAHGSQGVRVDIDIVGAGSSWRIKAKAAKGTHRASSTTGDGWIAKSKLGHSFYAAANLTSFNRQLIDEALATLRKHDAKEPDVRAAYDKKTAEAKRIEQQQQSALDRRIHGLKFEIEMEPFSGVEKDRAIKTEVSVTPNDQRESANIGLEIQRFSERFEVGPPQADTKVERVRKPNVFMKPLKKPPMMGNDRLPGYVVNMASIPGKVSPRMAARYFTAAWKNSQAEHLARLRTAVVIGVNAFRSIEPSVDRGTEQKIMTAVGSVEHVARTLMAVFGFSWEPHWTEKGRGDVSFKTVRDEWRKLPDSERTEEERKKVESEAVLSKLPYGIFRNEVENSSYTQDAIRYIGKVTDPVHILVQDADGGVQGADLDGILAGYDTFLKTLERHPLLTVGSYRFAGFDWGDEAGSRKQQLTELANEIDRAVRAAIAKVFPEMLYPSEPNMLIKAQDRRHRDGVRDKDIQDGMFGHRNAEGRAAKILILENNIGPNAHPNPVAHAPNTSPVTDPERKNPDRGLSIFDEHVDPNDPFNAVVMQSQNMISWKRLNLEMQKALEAIVRRRVRLPPKVQVEILGHPAAIGKLLAGDPNVRIDVDAEHRDLDDKAEEAKDPIDSAEVKKDIDLAAKIAKEIVTALTSDELRAVWRRLKDVLDKLEQERETASRTNQQ